jgi:hypothetical protein
MGESPTIRVSAAERDLAVTALWEHLGTGRLTPGEHEKRCVLAAAATTRADVEALFADLPAPHPDLSEAVAPTGTTTELRKSTPGDTMAGVGIVVLMFGTPAAIILTAKYGMWWTFFAVVGLTTLFFVLSDVVDRKRAD